MSLRVACDLDGTLADMAGALQREAHRLLGPDVLIGNAGGAVALPTLVVPPEARPAAGARPRARTATAREMQRVWAHVDALPNFWTTLAEIEAGAVACFHAARDRHGLEVIFLTQRPSTAGETTQIQTHRWLEAHGFDFPSVFVLKGSRGAAAAALDIDVVIDDRPENCLEVATESRARPVLVWRDPVEPPPSGAARRGIETVASFAQALRVVDRLVAAASRPTLASRLRRSIGL